MEGALNETNLNGITEKLNKLSTHENIPIKKILYPLRELITSNFLQFICNNNLDEVEPIEEQMTDSHNNIKQDTQPFKCNTQLFCSHNIKSIYLLEKERLSFVLDPHTLKKVGTNLIPAGKVLHEDEELNQNDCMFKSVLCKVCQNTIGRFFLTSTIEKEQICEKIIIFADKLTALKIQNSVTTRVDLKEYIKFKINESEEIKEFNELNGSIKNSMERIEDTMEWTTECLKIKDDIKAADTHLSNITRLVKYIEYSLDKLK